MRLRTPGPRSDRSRIGRVAMIVLLIVGTSVVAVGEQPRRLQARPTATPDYLTDPEYIGPPLEVTVFPPVLEVTAPVAPPLLPLVATDLVIIGLNFQGSQQFVDSGFIPPDTMGAVGPAHIVELINGRYDVYDKASGLQVETWNLDGFWTNKAGVAIPPFGDICVASVCSITGGACTSSLDCANNGTFDPRIVYDISTGRWFAAALDRTSPITGDNNIYVARSDTSDPTGDWDGFLFDADTVGPPEFHDYETLAVDADGLYMCTQDFGVPGGNESCYSIPKADLLLAAPTAANMTRFEATPIGLATVSGSWQPALDFGASDGRAALLASTGAGLLRGNILGAGAAGATLSANFAIAGDPGHVGAPAARQPSPSGQTIENVSPRFVSNVFEQGNSLWAVHAVLGSFVNSAIRWYEINETTNTVIQTGLIQDPNQDFHEPSIAVNQYGDVVIGYTCSGPLVNPSACVSVGDTVAGVTSFEPPFVVRNGAGHYWRDYSDSPTGRNRWGDYSATVLDPSDECTFWTFQEFVAVSAVGDVGPFPLPEGGAWGIQVTEMQFRGCADVDLTVTKTDNVATATPGLDPINYVITVGNTGTSHAWNATVSDVFPAALSCTWTCTASAGSTCTAGPVAGNIVDSVDVRSGGLLTYNAACVLDPFATGTLSNTVMAMPDTGVTDIDPGDNSATDMTTLTPMVDLMVTKTDGVKMAAPGGSLTYTIGVTNAGPSGATGAIVIDPFPAALSCTWTCTASAGSACTPGPIAGDLVDVVTMAPAGVLSYTAVCAIDPMAMGWLTNAVIAAPPAGVTELNTVDNIAIDDDTGLSHYFSVRNTQAIDGAIRRLGEVLKTPVGGTSVTTFAAFLPPYINLIALDVQPNNDIYFAVERLTFVFQTGGVIVVYPGRAYLYTDATGLISQAIQGAGLNTNTMDALDEVNGKLVFSPKTNQYAWHSGGIILLRQQNAYEYDAGTISLVLDGAAMGLQSLDAIEVLSATEFGFSVNRVQALKTPGETAMIFPQNAYIVDTGTGIVTLGFDGVAVGNKTLDALTLAQGKD